jgi:DNA mismatch endonuclease (patch repair protein)
MGAAPSFRGLTPSSEAASNCKRANRKHNSRPERLVRHELRKLGLPYHTYAIDLPGNPDLVFRGSKVALFCDGDFWHGRNWRALRGRLSRRHNPAYWIAKIARNRRRDRIVNQKLLQAGWQVIRVWETDILRDPSAIAKSIDVLLRQNEPGMSALRL